MIQVDINCDTGEGAGNEALILPFISAANIACGFHAGNENEMRKIVRLCLDHHVAIGAHPSFPDKENFGRLEMNFPPEEIHRFMLQQLNALNKIVMNEGGKLHHVKPHGALYNMAAKDAQLSKCLAAAVKEFDGSLIYYGLSGSYMISEALKAGLPVAQEVFADRTYEADGSLTPRSKAGALITDVTQAVAQVKQMVQSKKVTTTGPARIPIQADTICIHGDSPQAVIFAKEIYNGLIETGIRVQKI